MTRRQSGGAETWDRLREWHRGQAFAERLAVPVLQIEGYESIDPSHPLGGPDGLKDAVCEKEGKRWIVAVYFPRGQQEFNETQTKFIADLRGVERNDAAGMVFITNQELRLSERKKLTDLAGDSHLELYHLERLAGVLNSPRCYGIRLEFLDIEMSKEEQLAFLADATKRLEPVLELGFADLEKHRDLGHRVALNCEVLDFPELEAIPHYVAGPIDVGFSRLPGFLISNKDFYRQATHCLLAKSFLRPLGFVVRNRSPETAVDVQVKLMIPREDLHPIAISGSRYPVPPLPTRLHAFTQPVRPLDLETRVEQHENSWLVTAAIGKVQPEETRWSREAFYLGAMASCSITSEATVYADNLSKPQKYSMVIDFATSVKQLSVEELKELASEYLPKKDQDLP